MTAHRLIAALLLALLLPALPATAQDAPPDPDDAANDTTRSPLNGDAASSLPTVEQLEQRLASIIEGNGLPENATAATREAYTQAIAFIREANAESTRAAELRALAESAPTRLQEVQQALAQPQPDIDVQPPDDATLQELNEGLLAAESEVQLAKGAVSSLEAEAQQRSIRRVQAPQLLADARQRLDELRAAPDPPGADAVDVLVAASQVLRQAERAALRSRIDALTAEIAGIKARSELLTARRDLAARELSSAEKRAAAWQTLVDARKEAELTRQREESRQAARAAAEAHPALAKIGKQNEAVIAERLELAAKRQGLDGERDAANALRVELNATLAEVKARAEATASPTEALALLLRKVRDELPSSRRLRGQIRDSRAEIERSQLRLIELDQQRSDLAELERRVEQTLSRLDPPVANDEERQQVRAALVDLLQTQRRYLTDLYNDYDRYFNDLVEVSSDRQALAETVDAVAAYIDERVLWIRSTDPLGLDDVRSAGRALRWLLSPSRWAVVGQDLATDALQRPVATLLSILLAVGGLFAASRCRRAVRNIADEVESADDHFSLTPRALLPTMMMAAAVPLVCWLLAWRLWSSGGEGLTSALALALRAVGIVIFTFELIRHFVRPRGLGNVHFRWKSEHLRPLRVHLPWLTAVLACTTLLMVVMERSQHHEFSSSLGRIAYIVGDLTFAVAIALIFHPDRGILAGKLASAPNSWLSRLRMVWYPAVIMVPIGFVLLSGSGYHYSALQLDSRVYFTMWLVLAVIFFNAMFRRWLFVVRRSIALEQRRKRRAEAEAAASQENHQGEEQSTADEWTNIETQSHEVDLYTINVQTRKLLNMTLTVLFAIGLWFIWADVLPALGYFDRVALWTDADDFVSIADVAIGITITALTIFAARNIPGLLEMIALQRLPLEPAVRFAITTVVRYAITIIGIVLAFGAIGIGWSKVQWLAAAITVGLGFGLQEIFANFVSGLIILFEQPIRVGDIVTVGDVTGVVSRIRIRATTITDYDRKEYIVPNKEFVTGRMLNWTLSDNISRVTVQVGVAYGSDTEKARQLLAQVAADNPNVLEDPAPLVTFEGFGDSTLNLFLRAYLPSLDNRLAVITELHTAIDEQFKKAGIEIAFPQRDLHVRSFEPPVPFRRDDSDA